MANSKPVSQISRDNFRSYTRDVHILSGLIVIVLCLVFWPNADKQTGHYFVTIGLPIAMVGALLVGLLFCIRKLIQTAEKSLNNLKHANEEYQEEIEERKWTEAMLQESWAYSESIVQAIAEPLLVLDKNFRVIRANPSFYQTFKITAEKTINKRFETLDDGQWNVPEVIARLEKIIPNGEHINQLELTQEFNQIGERSILLNAKRIYGSESITNLILITMQDITEQRQAKEELAKRADELARSNKELEHFAYIASHDLQEPLRMVSSYCQLLQRRYQDKLDQDANDFIDFAVSGAKQMQTLINDLLAYSRAGTQMKSLAPVDCNKIVEKVKNNLGLVIQENDAILEHDPLPVLAVDDSQIMQVFQNLIANAIKFRGEHQPVIAIQAESKPGEWEFSIRDNGIGIDPKFMERIFVIFQRLHTKSEYPGTGIGLALCKKIVERHGGRIWVDSEPDGGSTFFFTLPKNGTVEA